MISNGITMSLMEGMSIYIVFVQNQLVLADFMSFMVNMLASTLSQETQVDFYQICKCL